MQKQMTEAPLYIMRRGSARLIWWRNWSKAALIRIPKTRWNTPLMVAVSNNQMHAVKQLVSMGVDLTIKNKEGKRALDFAYQEIEAFLEDVGAINRNGYNKLIMAAEEGRDHIVRELIAKGTDLNAKSDEGFTALSYAVLRGNYGLFDELLKAGADPKKGSVIELLIHYGSPTPDTIRRAEALMKAGAKLESTSELMYAVWKGDLDAVAKLIHSPEVIQYHRIEKGIPLYTRRSKCAGLRPLNYSLMHTLT